VLRVTPKPTDVSGTPDREDTMAQGGHHRSGLRCVVHERWAMPWRPRRPLRWEQQSNKAHAKESLCARRLYPN
jgi:hypothetical protein